MFKLCFLFFIVTFFLFPSLIHAKCCGTAVTLTFRSRNKNCVEFTGGSNEVYPDGFFIRYDNNRLCSITVCGDGEALTEGTYCGIGPCNIFSCNCDYGCREGNALENFKAIHGDSVYNIY